MPRVHTPTVFLSAYHRLQRFFPGARLLAYLSRPSVDPATANMWPYLLARQREADSRLDFVQASWLGHLWSTERLRHPRSTLTFDAVSQPLYAGPEDPRQLCVALRAILARLHTALAMTRSPGDLQGGALGRVVGAKAMAEGIWRIDLIRQVTRPDGDGLRTAWESALILEAVSQTRRGRPSFF